METRTILLSFMTFIVVGISLLIIYGLVRSGGKTGSGPYNPVAAQRDSVELIGPIRMGNDSLTLSASLPRSMNENEGLEFSYTAWILINDYGTGNTATPTIFVRGTGTPEVSFDVNTNTLNIIQKTYKGTEEVKVRNMPAEKLFHLGVVVTQTAMDVYVNGLLHTHKSLESLPLIEEAPVNVAPNGGWKGMIANLIYYNYALSAGEIRSIAATKATPNPALTPPEPPYFSTSWWVRNH